MKVISDKTAWFQVHQAKIINKNPLPSFKGFANGGGQRKMKKGKKPIP
jgi:hypothetical protein